MRAQPPLPDCPNCGRLARPNVLMFGDWSWQPQRSQEQAARLRAWLEAIEGNELAIVECGAGTAVPSVRRMAERLLERPATRLIRINARELPFLPGRSGWREALWRYWKGRTALFQVTDFFADVDVRARPIPSLKMS